MALLALIAWQSSHVTAAKQLSIATSAVPETVQLTITGAVQTPGTYTFPAGVSLREVLRAIPLQKKADRKALDKKRCYYCSDQIEILYKQNVEKKKKKA